MKFESRCTECDELATVDREKSNENWTVYKTTCEKCGGRTSI